jgi:DNA polymerase III alpha subunit
MLNNFINRQEYTTEVKELDELLEESYHYIMYQESCMKYLIWLGMPEDSTYDIIKKISKKKFKEKELKELKDELLANWIGKVGTEEGFEKTWTIMEDFSRYAFNASHSLSVGLDSLYGAYLKANYPLEYMEVVLNQYKDDIEETSKIVSELKYFNIKLEPIKFRYSKAEYSLNKEDNSIYKGVSSLKYCNSNIAEELYGLRDKNNDSFIDLLIDIVENTSTNSRQLEILIKLDYFSEFGGNKKLLDIYNEFTTKYKKTYVKKTKVKRIAELKEFEKTVQDGKLPIKDQITFESEILGYVQSTYKLPKNYLYVIDLETKYAPKATCYCLASGVTQILKIDRKTYNMNKFNAGDIIFFQNIACKPQSKKVDDKWQPIPGTKEWWLKSYEVKNIV